MGHSAFGIGHWGGSALVKQRGLGGFPHERLLKGFPGLFAFAERLVEKRLRI